jgi:hypothetical protein
MADPARPGRVVVGMGEATKKNPVEVVYTHNDRRSAFYRSPDPGGFEVCEFLRYSRLQSTPGPIEVTVWRGESSSPLRLEYDGRSCVEEPKVAAGKPPRQLSPLVIPTVAPPTPTKPVQAQADRSIASARVERVVLFAEGNGHRFLVQLDRDVRLSAKAQVLMKRLIRIDSQEAVLSAPTTRPVRPSDRGFDWKTPPGLLRFDPPLRKGEKLRLSFEIEGRPFDGQTVTLANPS